jgi:hypothetical protein
MMPERFKGSDGLWHIHPERQCGVCGRGDFYTLLLGPYLCAMCDASVPRWQKGTPAWVESERKKNRRRIY